MRARDRLRAVFPVVARVTEAAAVLAHSDAVAVLRSFAAGRGGAVEAVPARLAVATAEGALAVLGTLAGAAARLRAIDASPLEVTLADAVRADTAMVALVGTVGQGRRAVDPTVAFLADALAAEAEAMAGAVALAGDRHVACLTFPVGLAETSAEAARTVASAVAHALEESHPAIGA